MYKHFTIRDSIYLIFDILIFNIHDILVIFLFKDSFYIPFIEIQFSPTCVGSSDLYNRKQHRFKLKIYCDLIFVQSFCASKESCIHFVIILGLDVQIYLKVSFTFRDFFFRLNSNGNKNVSQGKDIFSVFNCIYPNDNFDLKFLNILFHFYIC